MNPANLLDALASEGVSVSVTEGSLRVTTASGAMKPDLAAALTERRSDLLRFLSANGSDGATETRAAPATETTVERPTPSRTDDPGPRGPETVRAAGSNPDLDADEDRLALMLSLYLQSWPTAREMLAVLREWGVSIVSDGEHLHVRCPPRAIPTDELRAILTYYKAEMLELPADERSSGPEPEWAGGAPDESFAGERSPIPLADDPDDRPAHSWPITPEELASIRFIETWNARVDREAENAQGGRP